VSGLLIGATESAGSRNRSAIVAPKLPRTKVRRERCLFVMNSKCPRILIAVHPVNGGTPACYCNPMDAASGLNSLLEPLSRCLDAESARRIVDLQSRCSNTSTRLQSGLTTAR
jgi:hypothetical protein